MEGKLASLRDRITNEVETSRDVTLAVAKCLAGKLNRIVGQLERGKFPMRDTGIGKEAAQLCDQLAELNILRSYLASLNWVAGPETDTEVPGW